MIPTGVQLLAFAQCGKNDAAEEMGRYEVAASHVKRSGVAVETRVNYQIRLNEFISRRMAPGLSSASSSISSTFATEFSLVVSAIALCVAGTEITFFFALTSDASTELV